MRIAYVYDAVYPWVTGGVEKRVWEFARRLADDHEVHWYGLHWWDGPSTITREGVRLHGVAPGRELYVGDRRSIPEALAFAVRLVGPLLRADVDVIDCQQFPYFPAFPARLAAAVRDAPLVVTWHEVWGDYWQEYLGRPGLAGQAVERAVAALPDAHVAVSESTRTDLAALGAESTLVPNGIDRDHVAGVPPADREVDLLYAGRLIPEKGVDLLLRALATCRERGTDRRLLVVGEGPERASLEGLAADLDIGDAVSFEGFVEDHDDVLGLMRAAEAFVSPSRREGFGMTVLEALACGTPVVTVEHPDNAARGLVDDGRTGFVTAPTAAALADGLRDAPALSAADCRAATADYDWSALTADIEAVYEEVAG